MPLHVEIPCRDPRLQSCIAGYYQIYGDGGTAKTILPRPGAALVIGISGAYRVDARDMPSAAVFGIQSAPFDLFAESGPIDRVQVLFRPWGLSRFIDLQACAIFDGIVPAGELFAAEKLRALRRELAAETSLESRSAALDRFFSGHYSPPHKIEEQIAAVAARISTEPEVPLGEALREIPASLRQTERLFARVVGTSPRTFARLARFERAKAGVLGRSGGSLADVALRAGYYDQAQFGRDFRRHAGVAPGAFNACLTSSDRTLGRERRRGAIAELGAR